MQNPTFSDQFTTYINKNIQQQHLIVKQKKVKLTRLPSITRRLTAFLLGEPPPKPEDSYIAGAIEFQSIPIKMPGKLALEINNSETNKYPSINVADDTARLVGVFFIRRSPEDVLIIFDYFEFF